MITTRVGRRGQITLPKAVRRFFKLREGDRIAFIRRGDEILLQPLTHTLLELKGSVPVSGPQDFTAIRQQVIRSHAQKVARDER